MKRINPKTGKPFKQGDLREDGFIFKTYTPSIIKKDGFFLEDWRSPKAFENVKKTSIKQNAKTALTFRGRAIQMLARSRNRAKESNIPHSIVLEDILPGVEAGFCQLTKLPFDLKPVTKTSQNPYAPSIDRIDSLKGYTKDNIRIVLYSVNAALGQFGTAILLPILKAMITGIENAKQNTTTPVPAGPDQQGEVYPELGSVSTPWIGQDSNNLDDYRGAVRGENTYHSAKEGSGDSVGHGVQEVESLIVAQSIEATWPRKPKVIWVSPRSGHLSD